MFARISSPATRRAGLLLRLTLIASLSAFAARPQSQQGTKAPQKGQDEEVVTVGSHLVNVDVSVKDKKGNYVNDLKAEDFTVFENGVRQRVEFFNPPLAVGASTAADTTPDASGAAAQPGGAKTSPRARDALAGNVISLVLDGLTTDAANMKHVREGTIKYIRGQVADTDAVALFAVTGGLQLLQPFTRDKDALVAAVEKASAVSTASKNFEQRDIEENIARLREASSGSDTMSTAQSASQAAGASSMAAAMTAARVLQQYLRLRTALGLQQSRPVLAALAAICEAQRTLPGKKTLVLFSQGFVTPEVLDWQVQSVIDIANRANVAIYIIDSAGLKASAPLSGAYAPPSPLQGIAAVGRPETRSRAEGGENEFDQSRFEGSNREHDILYRISEDTGGKFVRGTNDIAKGLARIDQEVRTRYTLAFQSTDPNFDGGFRKLKIEVGRPDAQVIARPGYYAIAPDQVVPLSPEERRLLAGIGSPGSNFTLPLFVELSPFRSHEGRYVVPLALEVPHDAVQFEQRADRRRMQLDVLVVVREGKDNILSRLGGSFDVLLSEEQYQSILHNNVFYRQDVELAPGAYSVDVVVRDKLSGKTAARRERLVLPEAGAEFSATDAVLSRHVEPLRETPAAGAQVNVLSHAGALISPLPSREFSASDNLIIFFDLYNAANSPATGKPQVKVTVTLLKDGKAALKPIDYELNDSLSEPVPHLTFAKYISLSGLAPGKYTALIEAGDAVAHKLLKQQTSFVITK
ncbi:MAG TPA: VWA domain-containing protein [Pyrinomonadaceae bacterium]|jgi:VWFA-related protein|nr:VWA domain-containing protein [Pyrinomonadaceae bacterium]